MTSSDVNIMFLTILNAAQHQRRMHGRKFDGHRWWQAPKRLFAEFEGDSRLRWTAPPVRVDYGGDGEVRHFVDQLTNLRRVECTLVKLMQMALNLGQLLGSIEHEIDQLDATNAEECTFVELMQVAVDEGRLRELRDGLYQVCDMSFHAEILVAAFRHPVDESFVGRLRTCLSSTYLKKS